MIRLSACIEMIFTEVPFLDRIAKVSEIGLPAFEFWGWGSKDIDDVERRKRRYGLEIAAFGVDPSVSLVDRDTMGSFLKAVEGSIEIAHELDCKTLIVTTGNELKGVPRGEQHERIVKHLKEAAATVEREKVTLVLEPLNILVNHMGYYLSSSSEGLDIIKEVGSPNLRLLYDIYHQQITEGNLISTITKNIGMIGHFHAADVPGRHEPGTGEINYSNVLKAIRDAGYQGYVGLELAPTKDPKQALKPIIDIARGIK